MKKLILSTAAFLTALTVSAPVALADYGVNCQTQYGTSNCPTTTTIVVNKTVQNPSTKQYVDNLGAGQNDPKYAPSSVVPFKITVTNTGNTKVTNLTITDTIPQYTTSNTKGGSNQVFFTVDSLNPGESKTYDLNVQVVPDAKLPTDQNIICVTNKADANATAASAHDEASFCISHNLPTTKGGTPIYPSTPAKTTPKTGPELLALIGLIPSGLTGFALRRKSKLN